MKIFLSFLLVCLVPVISLFAQTGSINNTLGPNGSFIVKDNASTFLSLNQQTGQLSLNRSVILPYTTDSALGVIYKNYDRFIHNYSPPGAYGYNTFIGINSGNFTMTASSPFFSSYNTALGTYSLCLNTTGSGNTAVGSGSLFGNTTGFDNTAIGNGSLNSNTIGNYNTAIGKHALTSNTNGSGNTAVGILSLFSNTNGSDNCAIGSSSLRSNTTGVQNTAMGSNSLYENTAGYYNTAMGNESLRSNTTGAGNTAMGNYSLYLNATGYSNTATGYKSLNSNNTGNENSAFGDVSLYSNISGNENSAFGNEALFTNTGSYNSAFGSKSLQSNSTGEANTALGIGSLINNTSGSNNTAIGNIAGGGITTGNNNIAVGFDAQVPNGTISNQVRIGNTSISYAGIQVAWSITSDKRWKENINPSDLGLDFISKLNPVLYTRINDESQKIEYGLIAQELEQVLKEEGVINSAMLTIDGDGRYELRYNDLFAPMIKAIQELKQQNDKLATINEQLVEQNESFRKEIEEVRLTISSQIEDKIISLLTQVSESESSSLNIALEK